MSSVLVLLLSLLISQDVAAAPDAAPAAAPVSAEAEYPIPAGAPSDDYGLVGWCYGALSGHMSLYDRVIGDVEDIENEIGKIPGAPPADMNAYKVQRDAGKDTLKQFRRAMEAAEKASPKPIAPYGAESLKLGSRVWSGVRSNDKKYLAREWMSWGLPGRCLPTAERLEAKASLFGQALSYNTKPAAPAETPAPAAGEQPAPSGIDAILPGEAQPAPAPETKAEEPALRGPQ